MLKGHKLVLDDTVDTDVVVIAISCFNELSQFGLEKLWIEFGVEKNKIWIPIHGLTSVPGIKSAELLFCYAFTGCDTVSVFGCKGKLSAWTTWRVHYDIKPVFEKYSHSSNTLKSKTKTFEFWKDSLAYFTVHWEVWTNSDAVCRRHLFSKQDRQVDTISPTKDALLKDI